MSPGPSSRHSLDQVIAFNLEVQGKLRGFERDLRAIGYGHNEAWSITRALEERILGPVLEQASGPLPAMEDIDSAIRDRLAELER